LFFKFQIETVVEFGVAILP